MKIRVTLIFLLSTSIAADNTNGIETQRISSNNKFPERTDLIKRFLPVHRVYEYSRSLETVDVDVMNHNSGRPGQLNKPVYHSEPIVTNDLSRDLSGSYDEESGKSLQQLATVRINSKQPSEIFGVGYLPVESRVLSRKKKDQMEQAILALLMAYKMKFTALIPIMLGGLSLLISTTALAGFFFALFAAVLGLKAH